MIRAVTCEDIPSIKRLMQSEPGFWHEDWRDDALERAVRVAGDLTVVWVEANEIVGFACAQDLGFRAYLSDLIVAKHARKRGIGKALLAHIESELSARGCTTFFSDVWKTAETFYRSVGWTPPDAVLLRKKIEVVH